MHRLARTNFTLLLVGEGGAEIELGYVVRDCYLPRGCGKSLTLRNAHGFGGANALDLALELQRQSAYDRYGVVVDTDQHWNDIDRRRAQAAGITCIENYPCVEATLLAVAGRRTYASTRDNKAEFENAFGAPAHRGGVIARHFDRAMFDTARVRVGALEALLSFLRC